MTRHILTLWSMGQKSINMEICRQKNDGQTGVKTLHWLLRWWVIKFSCVHTMSDHIDR